MKYTFVMLCSLVADYMQRLRNELAAERAQRAEILEALQEIQQNQEQN